MTDALFDTWLAAETTQTFDEWAAERAERERAYAANAETRAKYAPIAAELASLINAFRTHGVLI